MHSQKYLKTYLVWYRRSSPFPLQSHFLKWSHLQKDCPFLVLFPHLPSTHYQTVPQASWLSPPVFILHNGPNEKVLPLGFWSKTVIGSIFPPKGYVREMTWKVTPPDICLVTQSRVSARVLTGMEIETGRQMTVASVPNRAPDAGTKESFALWAHLTFKICCHKLHFLWVPQQSCFELGKAETSISSLQMQISA